jgi:arsenate reductase (thioredoxin)
MEPTSSGKPRVLFLCTGNCCRSPMAEALFRHIAGDRYESLSAGVNPAGFVHPLVLEVLVESGIDAEGLLSKHIDDFLAPFGSPPELIISLCDYAEVQCPDFPPETGRIHWLVRDPYTVRGDPSRKLAAFRQTRDIILERLEKALASAEIDAALRVRR